jgi:adenylosuccinate synthase
MPVSIVVGIRFGSGRKGKVALEAARCDPTLARAIRVGGTNAGRAAVAANDESRALQY